jgi:cytochrome c-type biogenesis protein
MGDITGLLAFIAGVLSFLSPCVLALAPGYIFMIASMAGDYADGPDRGISARRVLPGALLYCLGFSLVFISFGAAASGIGHTFRANREAFTRILGAAVMLLGLYSSGLIRIGFLDRQRSPLLGMQRKGAFGCLITGAAFAFGWSPCVGPILGTILALAGSAGTMTKGIGLLALYSVGLALPFIVLALAFENVRPLVARLLRKSELVEKLSGLMLFIVGLLMVTGRMFYISAWLLKFFGSWTPDNLAERLLTTFRSML